MRYQQSIICLTKATNDIFIRSFTIIFVLSYTIIQLDLCFSTIPSSSSSSSLKALRLDGHFTFENNEFVARDFGNRFHFHPIAVLHPRSVSDIAATVRHVSLMGLTVTARGHGHSLQGQSQSDRGVVIDMRSLGGKTQVHRGGPSSSYVDAPGGELWINVLHESLKLGLAPRSWTDYLHLTIGGTLSNSGISGQAFRHGPQISNVLQLEVVTGKGEVLNCSENQNADLFHAVLGGLGQFGIITRARIKLEPAPKMVKWIRVLYSDFFEFTRDQERLISSEMTFDYIEGMVIKNRRGLLSNWRSSFDPKDPVRANEFESDGKTLFCLELTKTFDPENEETIIQEIEGLLSQLSYIKSTLFISEVSYVEFLDRVHASEIKLREKGLWDLPHPWLNLLIPRSKIQSFASHVFENILADTNNGPVLVYPLNKSKWNNRTSVVLPEEDIFYLVAFMSRANPKSNGTDGLEHILSQNQKILDFCEAANLGAKQYLPHYATQEQWRAHFGSSWKVFVQRKSTYDPLYILSPNHRIFQRQISSS